MAEQGLVAIGTGEQQANAPGVAQHHCTDLQQFEPESYHLRVGQFGVFPRQTADCLHQRVAHRGKQQSELIWPPAVTGGAVGEQPLLLDAVLDLTASTVDLFIEALPALAQVEQHLAETMALLVPGIRMAS